jgi:hypothetical protein
MLPAIPEKHTIPISRIHFYLTKGANKSFLVIYNNLQDYTAFHRGRLQSKFCCHRNFTAQITTAVKKSPKKMFGPKGEVRNGDDYVPRNFVIFIYHMTWLQ